MANVAEVAWKRGATAPDRVALRGSADTWSCGRLRERATAVAAACGVTPGDRVLLVAPSVPEFVAAYLGLHAAGAITVTANTMATEPELDHVIRDAGCSLVVAWHALDATPARAAAACGVRCLTLQPGLADLPDPPGALEPHRAGADDVAVLLYTSGTTGRPKGAMLTQANLSACAEIFEDVLRLGEEDVLATALPLFHVFGQAVVLGSALRAGACLSLLERFEPEAMIEMLQREGATVMAGVPTMYNALLRAGTAGPADFAGLRLAASGGASLPAEVLRAFKERFGCVILEGYGLTETTGAATFNGLDRVRKPGSVGIALPGTHVRIVGERGTEQGVDEVGEIAVSGPVVMKGYWDRPDATRAALRDGWLHTGDLGTIDADGDVRIVDRKKDLIVRGGYNVYPREVEETLYEHPSIAEVAVIGVPDDHYGEEVAAVIAPAAGAALDPDELRDWAKQRLSAYKVPRRYRFVDELPKGATGKILKRAIDREGLGAPHEVR